MVAGDAKLGRGWAIAQQATAREQDIDGAPGRHIRKAAEVPGPWLQDSGSNPGRILTRSPYEKGIRLAWLGGHKSLYDRRMEIGDIERCFDRAAPDYENHDGLEREIGERLLQRVAFARREPDRILDIGCGTGRCTGALQASFANADVFGLDLSRRMLRGLQERAGSATALPCVQSDLSRLPFARRSLNLVFCNLALQWAGDFTAALQEFRRVLRPEGMLLFSVPGPGSLVELRAAPGRASNMPIYMPDLRDVGDLLLSIGFNEPVMDSETVKLSFRNVAALRRELAVTGGAGFADLAVSERKNGAVEVSFEIVYGTAFGPPDGQPQRTEDGEAATFPLAALKSR